MQKVSPRYIGLVPPEQGITTDTPTLVPHDSNFLDELVPHCSQSKGMKEGDCEDRIIPGFPLSLDRFPGCVSGLMFGVLDGHGGSSCVDYIQKQLPLAINSALSAGPQDESIPILLKRAFSSADSNYLYIAKRNNDNSGTTAATATFISTDSSQVRLLLGSVGDSRAVLFSRDPHSGRIIVRCENPVHRPALPHEKRRIESMGGHVMCIQGIDRVVMRVRETTIGLSVSRAFGDLLMKDPKPVVSSVPEFNEVIIDPLNDLFVVLGTDGVFDYVPIEVIAHLVVHSPKAADKIVEIAKSNGSTDDRTCMVIKLRSDNNENVHYN